MTQFLSDNEPLAESGRDKIRKHVDVIRRNKLTFAEIVLFLSEDPPNASAAREALKELDPQDQIDLWSVSTQAGGVWERWERDALKYGDLTTTNAYSIHCQRTNNPGMKKLIMAEDS